jgi:NADPH:quinone reductase-like Zn-dependent oxidoreductase
MTTATTTATATTNVNTLPSQMKAALATGFGEIDLNIHVKDNVPLPTFGREANTLQLLIRVQCCALAPGDVRVLSGLTDMVQLPPGGHPYVIGSDVSGIVVGVSQPDASPSATDTSEDAAVPFRVGDYVVGRFDEPKPHGGVAEYRVVAAALCARCPPSIAPHVAAGLPASAAAAKRVVELCVAPTDKVLVIGGSGAVGSSVIQYAVLKGCREIVTVSTQEDLCLRLGATRVLDYRPPHARWWERPEYQYDKKTKADRRFDVVIDMVNGDNWTKGALSRQGVKPNGKYVSLLTGVETDMEAHNLWDMLKAMTTVLGRMLYSRLHPGLPPWILPPALTLEDGDLKAVLDDVAEGRLLPLVDPASPFPFTEQGVRQAMALQKSKHAHGKVVIKVAD